MKRSYQIKTLLMLTLTSALLAFSASAQDAPTPEADYGNFSSEALTGKAWDAMGKKQYDLAIDYTSKCIEMYSAEAEKMQSAMTEPAPKETASEMWALNDVGTCLFIRGQAYEAKGESKLALADYQKLVNELSFAQTWDPKGWFWRPSDAAKQRITVVEFEAL
ncbi:beta-glucanase precursor [Cerasicoccus arenae]|uniref:Tetratricopeptide repeat protein n=1 Tax=Cerasicoccus arenae TaxID=424488 RepID=A0A8J3DG92_9BACT|nr:beta-glucanase precursor [Cerasicoccus arenae]MBK1859077.1 hypothetical protein [Cerasicoccus arenae]GHC03532.1 hypothetical protein GCM10007047_20170 [Cerasicoccus arenae]